MSDAFLSQVVVDDIVAETASVILLSLKRADGGTMQAFAPGAHVELLIPNGSRRCYSICSDPQDLSRYEIAVRRAPASRGGSAYLHDVVDICDVMLMSSPRPAFSLAADAKHHVLIAGGIGITPFMPMLHDLHRKGASYRLHYLTKSKDETCFLDRIARLAGQRLALHFPTPDSRFRVDTLGSLLHDRDTQIYCCGPRRLMDDLREAAFDAVRPVRFEAFVEPATTGIRAGNAFEIEIASSGRIIEVGETRTMLEALRESDIEVPSSCEHGICGTCILRYRHGEPVHRDGVLTDTMRRTHVAACISRAKGRLVLDL
jgi:vanillate O-demethylase ferredoxin subunit